MQRFGTPTLLVLVYGDWHTVMNAREYRDMLINSGPLDEDQEQYGCYRIQCDNTKDVLKAFSVFRDSLKLECHIGFEFESEDKAVRMSAYSGNGWGDQGPICHVTTETPTSGLEQAAAKASAILKDALK